MKAHQGQTNGPTLSPTLGVTHVTTDRQVSQVKAGAALLDERKPGWYQQIDLEQLDLSSPDCCVLGQLYSNVPADFSSYWEGVKDLCNADEECSIQHGFALDYSDKELCTTEIDDDNKDSYLWKELRTLWVHEIVSRRKARS